MDRPELPRSWRILLGMSGGSLAFAGLLLVQGEDAPPFGPSLLHPMAFGLAGAGLVLVVGMLRAGGRDRAAGLAGLAAAALFGVVVSDPFAFLAATGLSVPAALVAARPHAVTTPLTAVGSAALVLAVMTLARVGVGSPVDTDPRARDVIFACTFALLATGLLGHAVVARSEPRIPWSRRARIGVAVLGTALLALSWAMGGHVFWYDIWPVGLAVLALPTFARWRTWPAGAVTGAALVAIGLVPLGTCELHRWTDAGISDLSEIPMRALQIGAVGPWWMSGGDGFTGFTVSCGPLLVAAGALWAMALVALAFASALRPTPR